MYVPINQRLQYENQLFILYMSQGFPEMPDFRKSLRHIQFGQCDKNMCYQNDHITRHVHWNITTMYIFQMQLFMLIFFTPKSELSDYSINIVIRSTIRISFELDLKHLQLLSGCLARVMVICTCHMVSSYPDEAARRDWPVLKKRTTRVRRSSRCCCTKAARSACGGQGEQPPTLPPPPSQPQLTDLCQS